MLFGTGEDAGKIMVAVDQALGKFTAKRSKKGHYALTINAASAEGLFALEFPAFTVAEVECFHPQGLPPHCVFAASAEMLAAD